MMIKNLYSLVLMGCLVVGRYVVASDNPGLLSNSLEIIELRQKNEDLEQKNQVLIKEKDQLQLDVKTERKNCREIGEKFKEEVVRNVVLQKELQQEKQEQNNYLTQKAQETSKLKTDIELITQGLVNTKKAVENQKKQLENKETIFARNEKSLFRHQVTTGILVLIIAFLVARQYHMFDILQFS